MALDGLRDMLEEWHMATAEPNGVIYEEVDAGGVSVIFCTPQGCAEDAARRREVAE
jgi:hypothetical protein